MEVQDRDGKGKTMVWGGVNVKYSLGSLRPTSVK